MLIPLTKVVRSIVVEIAKEKLMLKMTTTSVLLAMIIASCGVKKSDSDDKPTAGSPPGTKTDSPSSEGSAQSQNSDFAAKIKGVWNDSCEPDTSTSKPKSSMDQLDIMGSNISLISKSYSDSACKTVAFATRYVGTYEIKEASKTKSGGYQVPFKFDSFYLTFFSEEFALTANLAGTNGLCGFKDWKVGVEKKLSSSMPNCEVAKSGESTLGQKYDSVMVPTETSLKVYDNDSSIDPIFDTKKQ